MIKSKLIELLSKVDEDLPIVFYSPEDGVPFEVVSITPGPKEDYVDDKGEDQLGRVIVLECYATSADWLDSLLD